MEKFKNKMEGILAIKNKEIKDGFKSVEDYLSYKSKAILMASTLSNIFYSPYVMKGFNESLENDNPYFASLHIFPLTTVFGNTVSVINTEIATKSLEAISYASGGAFKWTRFEEDNIITFFIWMDPEMTNHGYEWLGKQLSEVEMNTEEESTPDISSLN